MAVKGLHVFDGAVRALSAPVELLVGASRALFGACKALSAPFKLLLLRLGIILVGSLLDGSSSLYGSLLNNSM